MPILGTQLSEKFPHLKVPHIIGPIKTLISCNPTLGVGIEEGRLTTTLRLHDRIQMKKLLEFSVVQLDREAGYSMKRWNGQQTHSPFV